jgi:hypothetical protein
LEARSAGLPWLLIGWSGLLVPVHRYGIEEVSTGQPWIWLEAGEGAGPHALWTIEQVASAAYDFGASSAMAEMAGRRLARRENHDVRSA